MALDMDDEAQRAAIVRWLGNGVIGRWGQIPPKVRTDIAALAAAQMHVSTGEVEFAVSELAKRSKAPRA